MAPLIPDSLNPPLHAYPPPPTPPPPSPPPGTEAGTGGATGAHNPERITHATAFSQTSIFLDRFSAILTIK